MQLKQNLNIQDFEFQKNLNSGASADVFLAKNKQTGSKLYAIKSLRLRAQESPADVETELNILEKIVSIDPKPLSFPTNYYGYQKEVNQFQQMTYQIVFDYYPHSLKSLIAEKQPSLFPFSKIQHYFKRLVNGLAFLQTLQVCHRDLKPANLLLDELGENIYLMDFGISNDFNVLKGGMTKRKMPIEGTPEYFSPELYKAFKEDKKKMVEINPYKSDVFSLGLIMLEMANYSLPKKNIDFNIWEKNIEFEFEEMKKKYENILITKEEKIEFQRFIKILRKCLAMKDEDRPDFISLFKKNIYVNDYESIKSHIMIEDSVKNQVSNNLNIFNNFELRGYSQDKNVSAKIWGSCDKIPLSSFFANEKYIFVCEKLKHSLENWQISFKRCNL